MNKKFLLIILFMSFRCKAIVFTNHTDKKLTISYTNSWIIGGYSKSEIPAGSTIKINDIKTPILGDCRITITIQNESSSWNLPLLAQFIHIIWKDGRYGVFYMPTKTTWTLKNRRENEYNLSDEGYKL